MHPVRTPVVGIAFAVVLLFVETLGVRALIEHERTQETTLSTEERAVAEVMVVLWECRLGVHARCRSHFGYGSRYADAELDGRARTELLRTPRPRAPHSGQYISKICFEDPSTKGCDLRNH